MAREQDHEDFKGLWNGVEQMLTSYTDARYVSDDYARELSHARTLPVDVERVSDDPPERIAAWLDDGQRRRAAQPGSGPADRPPARSRPTRRAGATSPTPSSTHADDLVRVGHFDQAWHARSTRVIEQGNPSPFRAAARRGGARAVRPRIA